MCLGLTEQVRQKACVCPTDQWSHLHCNVVAACSKALDHVSDVDIDPAVGLEPTSACGREGGSKELGGSPSTSDCFPYSHANLHSQRLILTRALSSMMTWMKIW